MCDLIIVRCVMDYSIEISTCDSIDQSYVQIFFITLFGNKLFITVVPLPMKYFCAYFDELAALM